MAGYTVTEVIESFEDVNYRAFLQWVSNRLKGSSLNYLLTHIKNYAGKEQIFVSGIHKVDVYFSHTVGDIPKGLLQLCRQHNLRLTNNLYDVYKAYPDMVQTLLGEQYNTLDYARVSDLISDNGTILLGQYEYSNKNTFLYLVSQYKYNPASLLHYIDDLMTYEAIESESSLISQILDHVRMMSKLSRKFEKYPKCFLTTHRIASRNYNRLKIMFDEQAFKKIIDKELEWKNSEWVVIYPENTQDIKDEAVQQNNCVASYINRVLEGESHIVFLRHRDTPDKSVVTVQVRNYQVVQAKGSYNSTLTNEEQNAINEYKYYLEKIRRRKENVNGELENKAG